MFRGDGEAAEKQQSRGGNNVDPRPPFIWGHHIPKCAATPTSEYKQRDAAYFFRISDPPPGCHVGSSCSHLISNLCTSKRVTGVSKFHLSVRIYGDESRIFGKNPGITIHARTHNIGHRLLRRYVVGEFKIGPQARQIDDPEIPRAEVDSPYIAPFFAYRDVRIRFATLILIRAAHLMCGGSPIPIPGRLGWCCLKLTYRN